MAEREVVKEPVDTSELGVPRIRSMRWVLLIWISIAIAVVVGCTVLFLLLPTDATDRALRTVTEGILLGGVYALIALGVVVVFKSNKVFNLAHGGVLMFLAYFMWWLLAPVGLPVWAALIIVVLAGILVGLAIDRFLMRHMIGQSGLTTFFLTLVRKKVVNPLCPIM